MNPTLDRDARAGDEPLALSVRVPADAGAARVVRTFLRGLARSLEPETLERLELLVSELVTNAFRHARAATHAAIDVRLRLMPDRVRAEIADTGAGFAPGRAGVEAIRGSGWGLFLTERLASRWGVVGDGGTLVWFELDRPAGGFDGLAPGGGR